MRVVVIGAGQAGAAAAAKLRALNSEVEIVVIGAESAAPYQRPPLSKAYLLGQMPLERLLLRAPDFWVAQRIDLRLGVSVQGIDPEAKEIDLGAERLAYDHLILTTGARVRALPEAVTKGLSGVHYVRNLADVDAMAPKIVAGAKLLVVGGGYIGLEAAAVARAKGLEVTLIEASPRILQRVAAPETSDYMRALHVAKGVETLEGVGLAELTGEAGDLRGARLSDGREIACDLVIAGVGVLPETDLAQAAGIALENGIAVDAYGATSHAGIWAAGDCASFPHAGARLRLESVPNAIDMAEAVAANILGAKTVYVPKPWFWSDQYDMKLQIAGLSTGYDRVVIRDGGAARSHWYFRGPQLVSVDAMNDPRAFMVGRRLIEAGKTAAPDLVGDPGVDLKTLL